MATSSPKKGDGHPRQASPIERRNSPPEGQRKNSPKERSPREGRMPPMMKSLTVSNLDSLGSMGSPGGKQKNSPTGQTLQRRRSMGGRVDDELQAEIKVLTAAEMKAEATARAREAQKKLAERQVDQLAKDSTQKKANRASIVHDKDEQVQQAFATRVNVRTMYAGAREALQRLRKQDAQGLLEATPLDFLKVVSRSFLKTAVFQKMKRLFCDAMWSMGSENKMRIKLARLCQDHIVSGAWEEMASDLEALRDQVYDIEYNKHIDLSALVEDIDRAVAQIGGFVALKSKHQAAMQSLKEAQARKDLREMKRAKQEAHVVLTEMKQQIEDFSEQFAQLCEEPGSDGIAKQKEDYLLLEENLEKTAIEHLVNRFAHLGPGSSEAAEEALVTFNRHVVPLQNRVRMIHAVTRLAWRKKAMDFGKDQVEEAQKELEEELEEADRLMEEWEEESEDEDEDYDDEDEEGQNEDERGNTPAGSEKPAKVIKGKKKKAAAGKAAPKRLRRTSAPNLGRRAPRATAAEPASPTLNKEANFSRRHSAPDAVGPKGADEFAGFKARKRVSYKPMPAPVAGRKGLRKETKKKTKSKEELLELDEDEYVATPRSSRWGSKKTKGSSRHSTWGALSDCVSSFKSEEEGELGVRVQGLHLALEELRKFVIRRWPKGIFEASRWLAKQETVDPEAEHCISLARLHEELRTLDGYQRSFPELCVVWQGLGCENCDEQRRLTRAEFTRLSDIATWIVEDEDTEEELARLLRALHIRRIAMGSMTSEEMLLVKVHAANSFVKQGGSGPGSLTLSDSLADCAAAMSRAELADAAGRSEETQADCNWLLTPTGLRIFVDVILNRKAELESCRMEAARILKKAIGLRRRQLVAAEKEQVVPAAGLRRDSLKASAVSLLSSIQSSPRAPAVPRSESVSSLPGGGALFLPTPVSPAASISSRLEALGPLSPRGMPSSPTGRGREDEGRGGRRPREASPGRGGERRASRDAASEKEWMFASEAQPALAPAAAAAVTWPEDVKAAILQHLWWPLLEFVERGGSAAMARSGFAEREAALDRLLPEFCGIFLEADVPRMVAGDGGAALATQIREHLEQLDDTSSPLGVMAAFDLLERSRHAVEEDRMYEVGAVAASLGGCFILERCLRRSSAARLSVPKRQLPALAEDPFLVWGKKTLQSWRLQHARFEVAQKADMSTSNTWKSLSHVSSLGLLSAQSWHAGTNAGSLQAVAKAESDLRKYDALLKAVVVSELAGFPVNWPISSAVERLSTESPSDQKTEIPSAVPLQGPIVPKPPPFARPLGKHPRERRHRRPSFDSSEASIALDAGSEVVAVPAPTDAKSAVLRAVSDLPVVSEVESRLAQRLFLRSVMQEAEEAKVAQQAARHVAQKAPGNVSRPGTVPAFFGAVPSPSPRTGQRQQWPVLPWTVLEKDTLGGFLSASKRRASQVLPKKSTQGASPSAGSDAGLLPKLPNTA
eukprot:TRINITY_DN15012_c0_g1_i2.p1 TRINITY_DN15012_c0_g1~~TRINITY_DN15012_c0_g1_i2.p1  ORF type:complete len:1467 (+),score=407.71 TRINITY_DN15012_c0_g1_i2:173-4573(+)